MRHERRVWMTVVRGLLALIVTIWGIAPAGGQPAPPPPGPAAPAGPPAATASAAAPASGDAPPSGSSGADEAAGLERTEAAIERTEEKTRQVRALIAGNLAASVDPGRLFDVPLDDDAAIAVELKRLEAVTAQGALGAAAAPPPASSATPTTQAAPARSETPPTAAPEAPPVLAPSAAPEESPSSAPPPSPPSSGSTVPPALWRAQLELDEARMAFLSLSEDKRRALLAAHAGKAAAAKAGAQKTEQKLSQAEDKKRVAQAAQERALEAASLAKSEASKLLQEERARLLGIKVRQADYEAKLIHEERSLDERSEATLAWRRRVADHIKARQEGSADAFATDALYSELRRSLRRARESLSAAIGSAREGPQDVPMPGPDRLDTAGAEIDTAEYDKLREEAVRAGNRLAEHARALKWRRAKVLLEQIESLNHERLELLPFLTPSRKSTLTSFSADGFDQALGELRQVTLVLRYHVSALTHWVTEIDSGLSAGARGFFATLGVVKVLALLIALGWWRRRADRVLGRLQRRAEIKRGEGLVGVYGPGALWVLRRIRSPLEWWAAIAFALRLSGPVVENLLEVRLFWLVASWTLGGATAVLFLDAMAARRPPRVRSEIDVAALRLRSLRVLGRVIVTFGLILALSAELVGKGTLYSWVLSTCWFAAIPIALLFVGWWRSVIFDRLEPRQRRSAFARWVVKNRTGYRSFFAAASGGVYLLGLGAVRLGRDYLSGLTIVRRVLAYLFRREITKQAEEAPQLSPLPAKYRETFAPSRQTDDIVVTAADEELEEVASRIDAEGGGVFAIVGERGSGKTTLIRRLLKSHPASKHVECPPGDPVEVRRALLAALDLEDGAGDEEIRDRLQAMPEDNALILDDAHRLVRHTIGGLVELDRMLALARDSSNVCTWVFAFDASVFQLVERARGTRPLFDSVIQMKPWSEEGIAWLLESRTEACGLKPRFDHLVKGSMDGDEQSRAELVARTKTSYYRLLWDYSGGNPAVALHFWSRSLGIDAAGTVRAGLFSAPPTLDLERLPDTAAFVLRAIVRLDPAGLGDIVESTRLTMDQVRDALRYASFRGYVVSDSEGRVAIDWTWFRAVTRVLQRKHFLQGGA